MKLPFDYHSAPPMTFGGLRQEPGSYAGARAVLLPVPLERTTSYVGGTRNAPREILLASAQLELWDEETQTELQEGVLYTLPEMELPFPAIDQALAEITRASAAIFDAGKFPVIVGGEHTITPAVVAAAAVRHPGLAVLQIDAHADLRDTYMGGKFNHACAMRRTLEIAPCTQVGIRSLSREEARTLPGLATRIFYDQEMRNDPDWIGAVVSSLRDPVYVTIDCDGLDPSIMPAVGTPEPGGLGWYELLSLLKAVTASRLVVGCDLVELCPIPGQIGPNFLCAKLISKMLAYRFTAGRHTAS
jgi:agmatinase